MYIHLHNKNVEKETINNRPLHSTKKGWTRIKIISRLTYNYFIGNGLWGPLYAISKMNILSQQQRLQKVVKNIIYQS